MVNKNMIDLYSIKRFLSEYSTEKILSGLDDCIYRLRYFNNEYNMNFSIFFILDKFVKVCKENKQLDYAKNSKSFISLVRKLFSKVK